MNRILQEVGGKEDGGGSGAEEVLPEFMNRLDAEVVFHPSKCEELDEVLEIELGQVQKRLLDSTTGHFLFRITSEGRQFLLQEGTDQRYGARHLKRAIERAAKVMRASVNILDAASTTLTLRLNS